MKNNIHKYLENHILITDGSFGTYYSELYKTQEIPESANIKNPDRVAAIHAAYLEAGAKLIRTNTFASNTVFLGKDWSKVEENIKAAVQIAKNMVNEHGNEAFIAGDIGMILIDRNEEATEIEKQYEQIAQVFIQEGIRIIVFETFSDIEHIRNAILHIKESNPDIFIMVQFCVNQFGYSNTGLSMNKLLAEASQVNEIDAIGLNCGVGPGHISRLFSGIHMESLLRSKKYLIALPNAGYPKRIRNRIQYVDNPEYFAEKGCELVKKYNVSIIGGCCGTNPQYIQYLADTVIQHRNLQFAKNGTALMSDKEDDKESSIEIDKEKCIKKGFLYDETGKIKTKKLIAVELAPPLNAEDEKVLNAARMLKKSDVDVLTFPDSPSGRTRIDSVLMAEKVKRETGMCVMPHICCRDKNAIAMRSLFMGAHINDINNMLIITGDPVPSMSRQTVKSVFNFDSVGLMQIANEMNEDIFKSAPLSYGGAINQGRKNLDVEIKRVHKKLEAGAEFFLSQPIFTKQDADRLAEIKNKTGARILCGIMPLISRKNALFMKNEIAGISVSDELIERYPMEATKEEGEAVGIAIACEMMEYTKDFADGYYFSFPFNRVYMLKKIMERYKF